MKFQNGVVVKVIVDYPITIKYLVKEEHGPALALLEPIFETLILLHPLYETQPDHACADFISALQHVLYSQYESWMLNLSSETGWLDIFEFIEDTDKIVGLFEWYAPLSRYLSLCDEYELAEFNRFSFLLVLKK